MIWVLAELMELDAVMVYSVEARVAVGVPLIVPVAVLNSRPEGRAGEIEYEVGVPPEKVGPDFFISLEIRFFR
jgi:hypothetical protein